MKPDSSHPRAKLGVIFIGRRRPGFDMPWGADVERRVRDALRQADFATFEPPEKAIDDPSLRRSIAACAAEPVDAIVVLQTTMGDARLVPTLAQLWPDPVILWGTPENARGDNVTCSLVGMHAWGSTLRQLGHRFELVYGDPDAAETRARLREAVAVATTVRRLRTVRLGMIGGHAPGFFAMGADPFIVHRGLGIQLQTFSLIEFGDVVRGLPAEAVDADVAAVKKLGIPHKDTTDDDLPQASRLYLGMRAFLENERLDALTVRCWPEMPNSLGQWPYLGIARLVTEGKAVVGEGDADGALSTWIGESLGLGHCFITDWLEHDDTTITLWHGGAAPFDLSPPPGQPGGPQLARHFNTQKPVVVDATLRTDMPVTLFRFWRCEGEYLLTARDAGTIKPRRHLLGNNGRARMVGENPGTWFEELCHAGMPHHLSVVAGHHSETLRRFARVMRMKWV